MIYLAGFQEKIPLANNMVREFVDGVSTSGYQATCKAVCGDGYAAPGEGCDDGNTMDFDGCSAQCQVEQGFNCYQFQGYTTRCFAKLCDVPINDTDGKVFYDLTHYNQNELYGHMCRTDLPIDIQLPADKGYHIM